MRVVSLVTGTIIVFLGTVVLQAQELPSHVARVLEQFSSSIEENSEMSFRQGFMGHVNESSSVIHRVRTDFSAPVTIFGFCDRDCTDIDLEVLRETSNGLVVVVADDDIDPTPIISFSPQPNRRYHVRAKMFSCTEEPCYYAISTFTY